MIKISRSFCCLFHNTQYCKNIKHNNTKIEIYKENCK